MTGSLLHAYFFAHMMTLPVVSLIYRFHLIFLLYSNLYVTVNLCIHEVVWAFFGNVKSVL